MNSMKVLNYRILLRKEPEGGYTVMVPLLPGCVTYGETIEEAIDMAKEAIIFSTIRKQNEGLLYLFIKRICQKEHYLRF